MLVRALTTFGGGGVHVSAGDVFELPEGVDWLQAGLVEVVEPEPEPEKAVAEPAEKAVKARAKGRVRKG